MLKIDPSDAIPIWKQIEEGVQQLVATGSLRPDDAVSSVREMARELRVNPLTVSKAYRRLADLGVLVVRRGEGTFVASEPPRMPRQERREKLLAAAGRLVGQAMSLSADEDETLDAVRTVWSQLSGDPGPRGPAAISATTTHDREDDPPDSGETSR